MHFFMHFFKDRRNLADQCFLKIAIFSSEERLLFMWGSVLIVHWIPARWSARSFPSMPVWLGIQASVV
jgi:hypothetical protein